MAEKKRNYFCFIIVILMFLCLTPNYLQTQEVSFPNKPDRKDFFVDEAGLIASAEKDAINNISSNLLKEQDVPIITVTIRSLSDYNAFGYTIEKYTYELFNRWGIGSEKRNYGILLLISKGDRRARIELGSAWGHSYNYKAQEIMNKLIIPRFKKGEFSQGILAGVQGLDALARGLDLPKPKKPWWVMPLFLGLLILVIFVIISLFKSGRKGWGWALIAFLGVLIFFILRAAARSGGSGGAFGGGFSGGGGASGSW